jgi:hypothetical protein
MVKLDPETEQKLVDFGSHLLQEFHRANDAKSDGFESVSRRGTLAGFRYTLNEIIGERETRAILASIRASTKLGFPHVGPVQNDGEILGFDSEAHLGL